MIIKPFHCSRRKYEETCYICRNNRSQESQEWWTLDCPVCKDQILDLANFIIQCQCCKMRFHGLCQGISVAEAPDFEQCQKCRYDLPPRVWTLAQYDLMDAEDREFWGKVNKMRENNKKKVCMISRHIEIIFNLM